MWAGPFLGAVRLRTSDLVGLGWRLHTGASGPGEIALWQGVRVLPWHCARWQRNGAAAGGPGLQEQLERTNRRRPVREDADVHAGGSAGTIEPGTERRYSRVSALVQRVS